MAPFHEDLAQAPAAPAAPVQEYGRFNQHIALLEDRVRVARFLEAIALSTPGAVAVDVGAGTGVWALAALRRGYDHAVLIEPSAKMCRYAAHLAERNGLADRITIIPKALEDVAAWELPGEIDLLISETLSSVIFGFGSWDALPALAARVPDGGAIVPARGTLMAALAGHDLSARGPGHGGLWLLGEAGLELDLFDVAFRSGGNVWDKTGLLWDLHRGALLPAEIASFDFRRDPVIDLTGAALTAPSDAVFEGVVLHWNAEMLAGSGRTLSSIDPDLTSWAPLFVRFKAPVRLARGQSIDCAIALDAVDRPYKYAIRLWGDGVPLSERLYW